MRESSTAPSGLREVTALSTARRATPTSSLHTITVTPSSMDNKHPLPADSYLSAASGAGMKCKEQDFEDATSTMKNRDLGDETKVDVFVRCRGRSDKEVRENSTVAVKTDGVKGKTVELSLGTNTLSNKTYSFDKVFSPIADQQMIFDEVVEPVLEEVLKGFNCTIFAYGQTGTGKTFTMSGDISDHPILPDDAGIIPRVLHFLFYNLSTRSNTSSSSNASDSSVKVSFIELYNEELRDLLSADQKSNLKIFDGDTRRGAATIVQGMKEQYITSTKNGIQLLRDGSHKRQVAATKCNDLSSRSHTIFTVTVYTKRTTASGEEILLSGKLNLVDLAGSENIGRSGAENKRAVEAGLINKSLLTLGRVINALVDRSSHIPYRESKLTRLLQDSLGGRTKTCIIATVSPTSSNLEETTSTLDYAFRAKNIKNKPQITNFIPRKALLKDMTTEIERLESELTASRLRNGVYLTHEAYEELKNGKELQETLIKEQREKIEMIEFKLLRKGQDLLELSSKFDILEKDNEAVKGKLDKEIVLRHQHERTEQELMDLNRMLVTTLDQSTSDVTGLHMKVQRQSELHTRNEGKYGVTKRDVADATTLVEGRIAAFQIEQQDLLDALSRRMDKFVKHELDEFDKTRSELEKISITFEQSQTELVAQTTKSENELKKILGGAKTLKETLKDKMGTRLSGLSLATRRISDGIMSEVKNLETQLQLSYSRLSMDFKTTFDDMSKELKQQQEEVQRLWDEMAKANQQLEGSQSQSLSTLSDLVDKERIVRNQENKNLMLRIQELVDVNMMQQELRLGTIAEVSAELRSAGKSHSATGVSFTNGNEHFREQSREFSERLVNLRKMMKARIQDDYAAANKHTENLEAVTSSVHDESTRIVKEQVQHLDTELCTLDTIIEHIQEQNNTVHATRERSLSTLASTVQDSYGNLGATFTGSSARLRAYNNDVVQQIDSLHEQLPYLNKDAFIRRQLAELSQRVECDKLDEYIHTGQTPGRREYSYSTAVPRTNSQDTPTKCMQKGRQGAEPISCSKHTNLLIGPETEGAGFVMPGTAAQCVSLRELDVNTLHNAKTESNVAGLKDIDDALAPSSLKRLAPTSAESRASKKARRHSTTVPSNLLTVDSAALTDKENLSIPKLSVSMGRGAVSSLGRRLRSQDRRK